jgi:hypothetical protein
MSTIVFGDWRDDNQRRKFPFADDALLTNGALEIPNSLFIDGRLYPIGGTEDLYLSSVVRAGSIISFAITATGAGELAIGGYDVTAIPENGEIAFYDTYGRPAGMLLSTETALEAFSGLNTGTYEFISEQARFATVVVVPQPEVGVRGFILPSGETIFGDVWFVGENGVVVRKDTDGSLRVDLIGDPFAARKLCEDEEIADTDVAALQAYCPLETINGIAPDADGNFKLLPGSIDSLSPLIRITPTEQQASDVARHLGGESALKYASLLISVIGQRRSTGD